MDRAFDLRDGIPSSESGRLRPTVRRTTLVRLALAAALVAALALTFLATRAYETRAAPLIPSGTTGMVVLDLSASVYESAYGPTLAKMARTGEHAGLVVFSDGAYEVLPPGSPGRELLPLLPLFRPAENSTTGTFPPNPWQDFRAGTRISQGVKVAHEALKREGATHGSVLLISDLEILSDEVLTLGDEVASLRADGIDIRILPVNVTDEKRRLVSQIVGSQAFLKERAGAAVKQAPDHGSLRLAAPWWFLGAALLVVGLLAINEQRLHRLEGRAR